MDEGAVEDFARRINLGFRLDGVFWYHGERRVYREIVAEWLQRERDQAADQHKIDGDGQREGD